VKCLLRRIPQNTDDNFLVIRDGGWSKRFFSWKSVIGNPRLGGQIEDVPEIGMNHVIQYMRIKCRRNQTTSIVILEVGF